MVTQRLARHNLSDQIARQIQDRIVRGDYGAGDRLPPIREIARSFGVGPPTVREGLKKLEAVGLLDIRPGSGVYVGKRPVAPSSRHSRGRATRRLLADLVEARMPVETHAAAMAALHATAADLDRMRQLLTGAAGVHNDLFNSVGEEYHDLVALASGNMVIGQFLEALTDRYPDEHRLIWAIADGRECDHQAHVRILAALESRDGAGAAELMRAHLLDVRDILLETPTGAVA